MRNLIATAVMAWVLFLLPQGARADGGAGGVSPMTNMKAIFAGGGSDIWIRVQFRGEWHIEDADEAEDGESNHAVGGAFSGDIGTGFALNYFGLTPYYHYHFNDAKESGPYVGGYADFSVKSNSNIISIGANGGYQYFFNERFGLWGEANIGFGTFGSKFANSRTNGADFGVNVGFKVNFGQLLE